MDDGDEVGRRGTETGRRTRPGIGILVVAVAAVLLGVAGGAAAGAHFLGRTVTAEARLVVGDQSIRAQSVPGYALATQQLAATYARLIASPADSDSGVSASPIPDSAVIAVRAETEDAAGAIAAADAASSRLVEAATQARGGAGDESAVEAYREALTDVREAETAAARAAPGAARGRAQESVSVAQARAEGLAQAVREASTAAASGSAGVSVTQPAQIVSSSMPRALALGGFAGGVVVALVIGAIVVARGARRP